MALASRQLRCGGKTQASRAWPLLPLIQNQIFFFFPFEIIGGFSLVTFCLHEAVKEHARWIYYSLVFALRAVSAPANTLSSQYCADRVTHPIPRSLFPSTFYLCFEVSSVCRVRRRWSRELAAPAFRAAIFRQTRHILPAHPLPPLFLARVAGLCKLPFVI